MLSVGNWDERKGIGLDFGVGGEMEETELEEGEACYYQEDHDESIDPDVHLSYIDEKLQHVLGHFQKDFEGGVSAENLGAKFGGYGSFLPTYQRSPSVWSHPRTPQKVQNSGSSMSPKILPLEGHSQNHTVPFCAPLSARDGPASSSSAALPVSRVPFGNNSVKQDVCMFSALGSAELSPKFEHVNKSNKPANQKTLKVRIKMGNENLSARKKAEIYSGLGLDTSPSLEDSPTESGGVSLESREDPDESPTSILQIMTSFTVPGGLILSPLPDSLLHLTEKCVKDGRVGAGCRGIQESSSTLLVNESTSIGGDAKGLGDEKMKVVEKGRRLVEWKNGNDKDAVNDFSAYLKKEINTENPASNGLSKASEISCPSNLECFVADTVKGTDSTFNISREANKVRVGESVESISGQEVVKFEKWNAKVDSTENIREYKKSSSRKDISVDSRKDVKCKVDKSYGPSKAAFYDFEDGKDMNGGPVDLPKQVGQKPMSYEPDGMKVPDEKEQPFSGCKRRSKGTQSNEISSVELPKESLAIAFSAAQKDRKSIHESDCPSKSKRDGSELHKKFGKARERNGNSYGDIELELEESRTDWLQSPLKNTLKDSMLEAVEKETLAFADKLKDGSSGKEVNNMTSDSFPKSGPSIAPSTKNEPFSDAAPGGIDPVFIEENWVCCDRCQKWRLLPFGTNPNYLPKKWLCSMLNWLPGMNRCNVSEEETTKALYALYQIPVIDGQNNLQSHPHAAASGMTSAEVRHLDQNCQDPSFHALPSGGKKKHGSKEILNGTSHSCPMHSLNPTKKIQQVSLKSKSTNGVNQSPSEYSLMNGSHFQHLSKSSDLTEETSRHKQKEKNKLLECHSDGGDAKHLKKKNKRDADREGSRASKNVRAEGLSYAHEDWNFDHSGPIERVCSRSSGGLPAKATGNDLQKYNDRSHKISNSNAKGNVIVSVKRLKDGSMVSLEGCSEDIGTYDKRDSSAKKRKPKEWQDNRIYPEIFLGTENHLQHDMVSQKETNENMRRKEKKARVSKTECKEASTSRGSVRTDKKGRVTQIIMSGGGDVEEGKSFGKDRQQGQNEANNVTQGTVESIDLLKRDLGYGQSSMAATSSSSKVSGSRKTKTNFHELKGSPVESVSSSPLRICNPEKLTSTKRNVLEKDDGRNADFSIMSSPRRCSDGEGDGGGNLSGTGKKEIASSIALRESLESSIFDYRDGDAKHMPDAEAGAQTQPSSFEFEDTHLLNGDSDIVEQHYPNPNELASKNHCHNPDRVNYNHYHCNVSLPTKLGRGSISLSKEKHKSSNSNLDRGKFKASDLLSDQEELYLSDRLRYEAEFESHDLEPCKEEMGDGKHFCQDEVGVPDKDKNYAGRKDISGKWSSETSKRENQSKLLGNGSLDVKPSFICGKDGKSNPQSQDGEDERSSNRFLSDRTQRSERMELASGRGKPQSFPLLGGDKQEKLSQCPQALPTSHKGGGSDVLPVNTSNGDALKASKQRRKPGNQNGANISLRYHATHNGQGVKDVDTLHTVRKDSSQAAANVFLKEAADLKHMADRLKNSGSDLESIGLYFEAALQFLHGASLLEPCNIESAKHGEITQSMHVYSSTAKLCEFCARGYERCQHMAAAALAYKCMEVAYLRVTYSKHFIASRDRNELQRTLQMVPPGESPSSSASDVDNLNNQATLNRSNVVRLLNFAQDVGFAMEASEKSMNAFAAANRRLGGAQFEDGISSVKRVLDLNFQDVEGFLRLVRLAMEAIGR